MSSGTTAGGSGLRPDHDPRAPEGATVVSRRFRWSIRALLAAIALVVASVGMAQLDLRASTGLPIGAHDFVAYWSAYDVAEDGGNPYNEEELRQSQTALHHRYEQGAQRFWNPPWSLFVLLPVLRLPFAASSATWLVIQMAAGIGVVMMTWRLFRPDATWPSPVVLGLSIAFFPLVEGLRLGQMGTTVAIIMLGALLALRNRHDVLAGALLSLTIIKPQTVLVVLLVVGVHVLATRRWRVVISALVTSASLIAASWVVLPTVWAGWSPLGGAPTHWRTATLASWLRSTLPFGGDRFLFLVPIAALCLALPWAIVNRRDLRWDRLPLLLALSVITAPYAWVADSMLAAPAHVLAVAALAEGRHRRGMLAGLISIGAQFATIGLQVSGAAYHQFIVVPIGLMTAALVFHPPRVGQPRIDTGESPAIGAGATEPLALPAPAARSGRRPDVSIVVPAFQEEERIPAFLDALDVYVARSDHDIEVVIVDDGSSDATTAVAESYRDRISELRCITLTENRGKGYAVRTGMLAATGRRRVFIDADGSIDPSEIDRLLAVPAPVVIASVAVPGAVLDPPQGRLRAAAGALGNRFIQTLVLPGVMDSQRGCKVFQDSVAEAVFAACTVDRWAFDVEALALARKFGHEPVEVGIRWSHRDGGTVRTTTYLETLRVVYGISRRLGRQPEVTGLPLRSRTIGAPTGAAARRRATRAAVRSASTRATAAAGSGPDPN